MEKVKQKPKNNLWPPPQAALMSAFGFTEDDLQANREGYLSKQQRARLSRERQDGLKIVLGVIAGVWVMSMLVLFGGSPLGGTFSDRVMTIALICSGAALIFLIMGINWSRLNADLDKGSVYVAEGSIQLHIEQNQRRATISYHAYIGGQHFSLSKRRFDTFVDRDPYAIYYAPHSKTLLSAEWLREQ